MEYILGSIVLFFTLFLVAIISKKKSYKEVDRLEQWKIDIMNRPVLEEMSKVKQLNMTGQTEELFERWRNEWDEIVTINLPDVEEYLFDAEEYIDKYRFNRAKEVQNKIGQKLAKTEEKIDLILKELNELVGSEEKNRQETEQLKDRYREAKKNLLAHRHSFGKSETALERLLDEVIHQFELYEEKTENGNYLEAREIVLLIKDRLDKLTSKMNMIPKLLIDCQSAVPAQISDLREGYLEMKNQGYVLDHIDVIQETERIEDELKEFLSQMENAEITEIEQSIQAIKEYIEVLYDLLEKEVHSKGFVMKNEEATSNLIDSAYKENEQLISETKVVQQTYHLSEHELEQYRQIEKQLLSVNERYETLKQKMERNDTAQSVLCEELIEIKNVIETIHIEQAGYKSKLLMLRKDEMAAREKVADLKKNLSDMIRLVKKSNVPGLPEDYKYLFEDTKESIQLVMSRLEQKPLDMHAVQQYLEVAVLTVEKLTQTTQEIIECVSLAEKVIQYGNRYKSRFPAVDHGLKKAEQSFRGFDYQEALEQAAAAIEEVEPGALKRIEAMMNIHVDKEADS